MLIMLGNFGSVNKEMYSSGGSSVYSLSVEILNHYSSYEKLLIFTSLMWFL